jgi:Rrf2 family nitric oxide-sensitive transcriptional repressor
MRLTRQTDFGLRTLIYLALHRNRRVTASEISDAFEVSQNHLLKVIQRLANIGVIDTYRGKGGGISLAKLPDAIRIGDVVRGLEQEMAVVDCNRPLCRIAPVCDLKGILADAGDAFLAVLDGYTLEDLVRRRPDKLRSLLSSR